MPCARAMDSSASKDVTFSPVPAPDRSGSSSKGNLTGIPRKIKDSCADIYNLSQRWDTLRINGAVLLNKIAAAKLKSLQAEQAPDEAATDEENLLELCSMLLDVWTDMEQQVVKMTGIVNSLAAVVDLHMHNTSSSLRGDDVPFASWPVERFYETTRGVVESHAKELGVKKCIVEEVAMQTDEKTLSFYVTTWTYQAYIDGETQLTLEALVHEVGLK